MCQKEVSFFSKHQVFSKKDTPWICLWKMIKPLLMPTWNHRSCQKPCQAPGGSLWADEQSIIKVLLFAEKLKSIIRLWYDSSILVEPFIDTKGDDGMRFRRSRCESQGGGLLGFAIVNDLKPSNPPCMQCINSSSETTPPKFRSLQRIN